MYIAKQHERYALKRDASSWCGKEQSSKRLALVGALRLGIASNDLSELLTLSRNWEPYTLEKVSPKTVSVHAPLQK